MVELEYNPPHVMLWAHVTPTHLTDPCYSDGPVDEASYKEILEMWLIAQLKDRGLMKVCSCNTVDHL
jgi:hypothetical protein